MNDSIYEEYMRNVLGYNPMNTYDMYYDEWNMPNMNAMNIIQKQELEECYPEIYGIVYPMIQKACRQNTMPINRKLIDSMTNEIYLAIEDKEMLENREAEAKSVKTTENRQIRRNINLNDLIRILILREFLGRPGFPGGRPPRPPARPPRPPIAPPLRPPMGPPPRPQYRASVGMLNEDLYEY